MKSYCFSLLIEDTLKTIILVGDLNRKKIREYLSFLQEKHYEQPNLEKITEEFFNVDNSNQDKFSYIINENVEIEKITKFILDSIYNQNFKFFNDMLKNICDEAYFIFDGRMQTFAEDGITPVFSDISFVGTRFFNTKNKQYDYKYFFNLFLKKQVFLQL